jgi:hypothetical protein
MSTKIGGPHRCNIHTDFPETDDQNVWNEHCATTEGHTTTGTCTCTDCGCGINLNEIPYQPIGKEIKIQCPDCFSKNQDLNKLVNSQQQLNQFEQEAVGGVPQ